jgi:hypothetical protein
LLSPCTERRDTRYLYESGRCAVAHAHNDPVVDPDDYDHLRRVRADLPLVRALAEHAIEHALGVKSSLAIYREHLYQLAGFRELFGSELVKRLKDDDAVTPDDLPPLPPLSLRFRDEPAFLAFENLLVEEVGIVKGTVWLRLRSPDGLVMAGLGLDLRSEYLLLDFQRGLAVSDDGSVVAVEKELDRIRLLQCCVRNGQLEVRDGTTDQLLGRSDAIVPVNISHRRTDESLRAAVAGLQAELQRRRENPPGTTPRSEGA